MPQGRSEPFYFGREDEQLFGCLHVSSRERARESGIVLVPPMDQEYLRSHRALRQLAVRLALAGFPALRFDLYACGDSAGECERGNVARWARDVDLARAELATRTGAPAGAAVGLRLGAYLACRSALSEPGLHALVLWDPVTDGRSFLASLRRAHEEILRNLTSRPRAEEEERGAADIMGFPFPAELVAEIEAIDLLHLERAPAERVCIVTGGGGADAERLAERLRSLGSHVRLERVDAPRVWEEDASKALVPARALQAIVAWLQEELP